jgi:signal transduction histidine kinase
MQQMEKQNGMNGLERQRVEAVVETLATLRSEGQSVAEVAHDARNMVTALGLYCDLLEEPGVLAGPFFHYGSELRLVAAASRRLVEKLVALDTRNLDTRNLDTRETPATGSRNGTAPGYGTWPAESAATGLFGRDRSERSMCWEVTPAEPIKDLAHELLASRNLLAALAGPSIALTAYADGGNHPVRLSGEDLTRVLVNLVKNAAEAMPSGGTIQIGLRERPAAAGGPESLILTIEDNGPGIPANALESIFKSGYSSHRKGSSPNGSWSASHRGLGLSITRSIVEGAGGRILATNLTPAGARFELELPVSAR